MQPACNAKSTFAPGAGLANTVTATVFINDTRRRPKRTGTTKVLRKERWTNAERRLLDQALPTYVPYVVHLAIAAPMLVVEVPFGKWAHLLYRPLAIYIAAVKRTALECE